MNKIKNMIYDFFKVITVKQYNNEIRESKNKQHKYYLNIIKNRNNTISKLSQKLNEWEKTDMAKLMNENRELKKYEPYKNKKATIVAQYLDIKTAVREYTNKYEILDLFYTIPTLKELQDFLKYNKVSKKKWVAENFDCDNFATKLWAEAKDWDSRLALGFCTVTLDNYRHAINFGLVEVKNQIVPYFLEPQTDKINFETFPNMKKVDMIVI